MGTTGKKKGGRRKIGRSFKSPSHQRYTMEQRWIKNKRKRITKHIKRHKNDKIAIAALASVN